MFESNDSDQEPSVAQHDENDGGCPVCGSTVAVVERRGPGAVTVRPCGHDISDTLARNFPRTEDAETEAGA